MSVAPAPPEVVAARLEALRASMAAAAPGRAVRLVAVTKGFDVAAVETALALGLADVGENYADELLAKHAALAATGGTARWHLIGTIQRRTVARLAPVVDCWQTVAREAEAERIGRYAPGATVLVQVDLTGLPDRNGVSPGEAPGLVEACRGHGLTVTGLMTVGPGGDPERARPVFRALARLADRLGLEERSMGMTDDLVVALEEGATMVRVGRALFGDRPLRHGRPPP